MEGGDKTEQVNKSVQFKGRGESRATAGPQDFFFESSLMIFRDVFGSNTEVRRPSY